MSSSDTVARTLVAHTTVVNGLRITMNWFQSTFIVPSRIPDDDDFVAAIHFLRMAHTPPESIAYDYLADEKTVALWMQRASLPPRNRRLDILRMGFAYLREHGISFGGHRFSTTDGTLIA